MNDYWHPGPWSGPPPPEHDPYNRAFADFPQPLYGPNPYVDREHYLPGPVGDVDYQLGLADQERREQMEQYAIASVFGSAPAAPAATGELDYQRDQEDQLRDQLQEWDAIANGSAPSSAPAAPATAPVGIAKLLRPKPPTEDWDKPRQPPKKPKKKGKKSKKQAKRTTAASTPAQTKKQANNNLAIFLILVAFALLAIFVGHQVSQHDGSSSGPSSPGLSLGCHIVEQANADCDSGLALATGQTATVVLQLHGYSYGDLARYCKAGYVPTLMTNGQPITGAEADHASCAAIKAAVAQAGEAGELAWSVRITSAGKWELGWILFNGNTAAYWTQLNLEVASG